MSNRLTIEDVKAWRKLWTSAQRDNNPPAAALSASIPFIQYQNLSSRCWSQIILDARIYALSRVYHTSAARQRRQNH